MNTNQAKLPDRTSPCRSGVVADSLPRRRTPLNLTGESLRRTAVFCLLAVLMTPAWSDTGAVPWSAYFGGHYGSNDTSAWGMSSRDPGGPGRFGYWTPSAQSGRRDSGSPEELRPLLAQGEVVLSVGGLGSGRDVSMVSGFLDEIRDDRAGTWKRELAERVRRVASVPGATERVFWQFGNEINGPRMIENLAAWGGLRRGSRAETMTGIIPLYVEYFLAPGIEAIRAASQDVHGDPGRIHVMLGSLANARNPVFVKWYEQILEYTIQGDYAGSLKGRKVYELVDALSIHYLVTSRDEGWADILDNLAAKWMNRGAIRRIWSTEEGGIKRARAGHGASTALRVTARYLDWWQRHDWSAQQGHCFFWGADQGPAGTRATEALNTLYKFTGRASMTSLARPDIDSLESYLFDVSGNSKRVLIAFPQAGKSPKEASFDSVDMPASGWSGSISGQLLVYTPKGVQARPVTIAGSGQGDYRISPQTPVELAEGSALMVLLEQR